jgi:pyruvate/2-oxoacid:ferredoxin oxidoreductase alpha subunit
MMEHIGYAAMTETPASSLTFSAAARPLASTFPAQADMMQARWDRMEITRSSPSP